ncbi:MAG: phosphate-starvation-inducible PsiE family protein [bacterium]
MVKLKETVQPKREWATRVFTVVEDVVYLGLGLLLAGSSLALLVSGLLSFVQTLIAGSLTANVVPLLDRILLILLVVELLYTVQVSFREHGLLPEPFLLVGLIAAIRRVLVLTAEFAQVHDTPDAVFRHFIIELVVLTVLIVALVISLVLLRKRGVVDGVERAA